MGNEFLRTEMLLGKDGVEKLKNAKVCVFGVGGVGGYALEALARSGIGSITIVDNDAICESNINRQIIATHKTLGMSKVEAFKERIKDICPDINVNAINAFYLPQMADEILKDFDYVIDAIDTVTAKISLAFECEKRGIKIISSMGAGNKLDPTTFLISDIYKTSVCPLARVMRRELKKRGVKSLKVVYSKEKPLTPIAREGDQRTPGSVSFVPSVAGLIIASEVIKDLTK